MNFIWTSNSSGKLDNVQQDLLQIASECSFAIGDGFDACVTLLESLRAEQPLRVHTLRKLLDSCHLTSESVLILVANNKLWDADILTRSVLEGSLKLSNIAYGTKEEVETKLHEYCHVLPEITRLKTHDRLSQFIEFVGDQVTVDTIPYQDLLLSKEDLASIRARFPKSDRKVIEEKWSFHRLSQELSKTNIPELGVYTHLLHGYGMSSHLLHQDYDGISIIYDRNNRSDERREAVELAHGSRMISDVYTANQLRHSILLRLLNREPSSMTEIYSKYDELGKKLHDLYVRWVEIEYGKE